MATSFTTVTPPESRIPPPATIPAHDATSLPVTGNPLLLILYLVHSRIVFIHLLMLWASNKHLDHMICGLKLGHIEIKYLTLIFISK